MEMQTGMPPASWDAAPAPGTMVAGLQPRVMENGEGCVAPAARAAGRAPCLLPSDAGEG